VLSVGDLAATIVQCEGRFFLAVVQINEICFDASSLLEINPRFLIEPAVTVQFQIFQVVEAFNDDPDIDGADWKWNRWMENAVMKTKGSFIQAISPAVAIPKVNAPVYFFRTDELRAIAAALFSSIPLQDHPHIPNLRKRTNHFPYRTKTGIFIKLCICYLLIHNSSLGDAAFICEVEQDERLVVGPGNPQPNHCNQCRPPVFWDTGKTHKILEHVAMHLLFDNTVDASRELCGLCMRESPMCVFYLRKGKGAGSAPQIDLRTSRCPNLTGKFLYSATAKERINSPCTNVPIICPLCPSTSPTVWKYNMKSHLAKNHPSVVRGSDHFQQYGISESEKAALKLQWEKRHKVQRRKRKTTSTQLPVSDMHSSRYAFEYVRIHLMLLPLIIYSTTQSSLPPTV
jgi:hypothetical protein